MSEVEVLPVRPLDAKLLQLRAEGCSMEEISQRLNGIVSPVAAGARIKDLLKMKNWLTAAEEDQEITLEMRRILATLRGRFEDVSSLSLQLKILDKLGQRLDKRMAATQIDLNTYDSNIGRKMGQVVDESLAYMKGALREKVDPDLWDELLEEALAHAQRRIEQNQIEE